MNARYLRSYSWGYTRIYIDDAGVSCHPARSSESGIGITQQVDTPQEERRMHLLEKVCRALARKQLRTFNRTILFHGSSMKGPRGTGIPCFVQAPEQIKRIMQMVNLVSTFPHAKGTNNRIFFFSQHVQTSN